MNKLSLFLSVSSISIPALFAQMPVANQTPFISTWLIVLFLALGIIMFVIFWFMKNQSPQLPLPPTVSNSPYSNISKNDEIHSELHTLSNPKVPNQFYEVTSENKPIPDDRTILANMKSRIHEVKEHGIPKKQEPNPSIKQAVDEILEQEFQSRSPEFRGEKKETFILPPVSQIPSEPETRTKPVAHKAPNSKPITNLPLHHKMPKTRSAGSPGKAAKKSKKKKPKQKSKKKKTAPKNLKPKKKTSTPKKQKVKSKSISKKQNTKEKPANSKKKTSISKKSKSKPKISKKKIKSKAKKKR